jgi:phage terminase large subunit-like protein
VLPQNQKDFVAISTGYAEGVIAGSIPACRYVKLACQRHLDDLQRTSFEWHFDPLKAARVCKFIELLPHIKGKWATKTIVLEPWQIFILTVVFGWVGADANRRYRTVYIEVPRKNAKSTITSGAALYCLCENEPGAEVYSAATKKDQAKIVWEVAQRMVRKTPGLRRRFGVDTSAGSIFVEDRAASFVALSSDEDGLDGLNIHFAGVDELHAHKTRAVWDVLDSGTGSRLQPLIWAITTAGSNRNGICYEQRAYVINILTGLLEDERYFGIIYTIDLPEKDADGNDVPGDDWKTESAWRKANPNYGVSVLAADIKALAKKAIQSARSQNNFLTKRLDVWVNAEAAFYNIAAWIKCARPLLTLKDFEGEACWIGLDMSSKVDITAKVRIFKRMEKDLVKDRDGELRTIEQVHYYVFAEHYLPEDALESQENINEQHYSEWHRKGVLTLTSGAAIDYATIEDGIREDRRRFKVQEIGYDDWNAAQLGQRMEAERAPMVVVAMQAKHLSDPMKFSDALILSGLLHHDGDPALTWQMGNVVSILDRNDNTFPRKEKPEKKIDAPVAMITALARLLAQAPKKKSIYSTRGIIRL